MRPSPAWQSQIGSATVPTQLRFACEQKRICRALRFGKFVSLWRPCEARSEIIGDVCVDECSADECSVDDCSVDECSVDECSVEECHHVARIVRWRDARRCFLG